MRDVSFGQYYPAPSPLHRLDPRTKLLATIIYIVTLFFINTFTGFGIMAVFLLVVVLISRVPFGKVLRSVKAVLFLLVFTLIISFFFYRGAKGRTRMKVLKMRVGDWLSLLFMAALLTAMLFLRYNYFDWAFIALLR